MVWEGKEGEYEEKDSIIEEKGLTEKDMEGITKKENAKKDADNEEREEKRE